MKVSAAHHIAPRPYEGERSLPGATRRGHATAARGFFEGVATPGEFVA